MNYYKSDRTKFKKDEGINILETGEYEILKNGQIIRKEPKHGRNEINPETGLKYKKGSPKKNNANLAEIIEDSTEQGVE